MNTIAKYCDSGTWLALQDLDMDAGKTEKVVSNSILIVNNDVTEAIIKFRENHCIITSHKQNFYVTTRKFDT